MINELVVMGLKIRFHCSGLYFLSACEVMNKAIIDSLILIFYMYILTNRVYFLFYLSSS